MDDSVKEELEKLHLLYLKSNQDDEGDLLYYRINYRLADLLAISNDEAAALHEEFHSFVPRKISQGFCDNCRKVVTIIPVIYGVSEEEMPAMMAREREGRLIVGDTSIIREGRVAALFGCKECKTPLPKFGKS